MTTGPLILEIYLIAFIKSPLMKNLAYKTDYFDNPLPKTWFDVNPYQFGAYIQQIMD